MEISVYESTVVPICSILSKVVPMIFFVNRSSTLELTPTRMAQRLATPLRSLLEGQRPFTVSLNLASAEDVSLEVEEDDQPIPLQPLTHSTYTTAV